MVRSVGILGNGFVGTACYQAFSQVKGWNVVAYDKNPETCKLKIEMPNVNFVSLEEIAKCDLVIVCVPTPMKSTGECYTGILEDVIRDLRHLNRKNDIVIKSTVPPKTTEKFNVKYGGNIYFSPEFLTEANCYEDFINLPYQIIGVPYSAPEGDPSYSKYCTVLTDLFKEATKQGVLKGGMMILKTDAKIAEMVKLTRNCYLATRLSFFNEIKQICDNLGIDYDEMKNLSGLDPRIGNHYNKIHPGTWGGSCLVKDLNDLMFVSRELGVDPKVLSGVWQRNLESNQVRDWENLIGRAVVED